MFYSSIVVLRSGVCATQDRRAGVHVGGVGRRHTPLDSALSCSLLTVIQRWGERGCFILAKVDAQRRVKRRTYSRCV